MNSPKQKHILLCVLDWGLGHATRCIPIINELKRQGSKVSIAGSGASLSLLRREFQKFDFHELPSYDVHYGRSGFFFLKLGWQVPKILRVIRDEHNAIAKIVQRIKPDCIISDNRYGCYAANVYSVFITHQLNIQLPGMLKWASGFTNAQHHRLIRKFNACWVPDKAQHTLTGQLTMTRNLSARFIGPLSRFAFQEIKTEAGLVVGLVSGPETQRTIFENLLRKQFESLSTPSVIVRGLPQIEFSNEQIGNVTLISHLPTAELQEMLLQAEVVVARSGYSTVMDLSVLRKQRVIFIPTTGQTEQEYLAAQLSIKKIVVAKDQDQFLLSQALHDLNSCHGFVNAAEDITLLPEAVTDLLTKI